MACDNDVDLVALGKAFCEFLDDQKIEHTYFDVYVGFIMLKVEGGIKISLTPNFSDCFLKFNNDGSYFMAADFIKCVPVCSVSEIPDWAKYIAHVSK